MPDPDDIDDGPEPYWYDEPAEFDDPFSECGMWRHNGVYVCEAVGSEECDFECPFNVQIGRKRWYTPRRQADANLS